MMKEITSVITPDDFKKKVDDLLRQYGSYPFDEAMEQVYRFCDHHFPLVEPSGRFVLACWRRHRQWDYLEEGGALEEWEDFHDR